MQPELRLFGLKAYRRGGRRPRKRGIAALTFPNLLKTMVPSKINEVWISDFTYIPYDGKFLYLATVMDIVTREIVGYAIMGNHSVALVLQAFFSALLHHPRPEGYHSDNGREYGSRVFIRTLRDAGHRYPEAPSPLPGRMCTRNPSTPNSRWIWETRRGSERRENWCTRYTVSSGTTTRREYTPHSGCRPDYSRRTIKNYWKMCLNLGVWTIIHYC